MRNYQKPSLKNSKSNTKVLAAFFADSHLDTGAWANRPELSGDSIAAFRYICEYCVNNSIPVLVGAGDLIDVKKPPPEVVQVVRDCVSQLEASFVEFFFIQGQHEYAPDLPWFQAIHTWPQWLNKRYIDLGGKKVYGLDWHNVDKIESAIESIPPDTCILVMHQVWEELMGDVRGCEASFSQIPYATHVFTGDFHTTKELQLVGLGGQSMQVISPGSTNMRKIDEPENKYFYLLHEDFSWSRVRIPTRRKLDITVGTEKDLLLFKKTYDKALLEVQANVAKLQLPVDIAKPLVRVRYLDSLPDAYDKIRETVGSTAELFLRPVTSKDATEVVSVDKGAFDAATGGGLVDMIEATVGKDDVRYTILKRLIKNSSDMGLELQRLKKEYGLT